MAQMGMVINLHKCVGCGACAIACKTENNTQNRMSGQSYNWADFQFSMTGKFPKVDFQALPTLCNHCSNAACVEACPVTPKAMYKTADGITMHNDHRCIGCRQCQMACPYSVEDLEKSDAQYSVISFNFSDKKAVHADYKDSKELIPACTASGKEIAEKAGAIPPYKTEYKHPDYDAVRKEGVVEKCILCSHRLAKGDQPWCAESCPAGARVVGDLSDSNSEAAQLLAKYEKFVLKPEAGTKPNVFYIRKFKV